MHLLASEVGVPVRTTDELGLQSAAKEAYAFAVLGFLTVHGLGGTVSSCTGARHSSVLGSITPGRRGLPVVSGDVRPPVRLLVG
jgi:anhydro-N-acetylmuramic acid kinase